jgi:hypothetical protein
MKLHEHIDITDRIGPLYTSDKEPQWPMYSYSRPAYLLWNAIANQLHAQGWTIDEIQTWLQSKQTRWALDGELGTAIEKLGKAYAKKAEKVK